MWKTILKSSEFQVFVSEVFAIPRTQSQKLNPSRSLLNSIGRGKLLDSMTEDEFMNLMILAEEEEYEEFLKDFETVNINFVEKYKVEGNQEARRRKYQKVKANPVSYKRMLEQGRGASKRYREKKREEINAKRRTPEYREKRRKLFTPLYGL